jgi:LuxR family maltose regulon positive regulatory protein
VLLRSWVAEAALAGHAAWVPMQGEGWDPQHFWISVADALRGTPGGAELVRPLTAAPDLDGWAVVERLLDDLDSLPDRIWLIIDDLHELGCGQTLAQLELLMLRAPKQLRFVLATRYDLRLGLHRLRLEGELTEIRADDLRFTADEARALFEAAGAALSDSAVSALRERTEGWAAGLRLAALSLAGHPDPERSAAEFCGAERTVAEYMLAEVLNRQPEQVRRLLLRTSVLERVSGELADVLTGDFGGERILQDLEDDGTFVTSLDMRRSWFRYHRMFADLLQLELRRTAPGELPALHRAAANWFIERGYPVEAVRHAQAAQDFTLAARLLCRNWFGFVLSGQAATGHQLLTGFPAEVANSNAELTALMAADDLNRGRPKAASRHLRLAAQGSGSVPAERRRDFQIMLALLRLSLARQRGDLPAAVAEAEWLLAPVEASNAPSPGTDLRALALISLGIAELWSLGLDEAERHLAQGVAISHRIGQPYLEVEGLAYWAVAANWRSFALAADLSRQAIDLAGRHGWTEDPVAAVACLTVGTVLLWQGRLDQAEQWLDHAERNLHAGTELAARIQLHYGRGEFEMARRRYQKALVAFGAAEEPAELVVTHHPLATKTRAYLVHALVRLGETGRAEAAVAELDSCQLESEEIRTAVAELRIAQGDPQAATEALASVLHRPTAVTAPRGSLTQAFLLEAIARDALGDPDAAGRALARALDLAAPERVLLPFLIHQVPVLLERHRRSGSAHETLISDILALLDGPNEHPPGPGQPGRLREPLSRSETRVLRYLTSDLTVLEIAGQLFVSVNTVRTHLRRLYAKLDIHSRRDAVKRARALGLLPASAHGS